MDLLNIDFEKIVPPHKDVDMTCIVGKDFPNIDFDSTENKKINLRDVKGTIILFIYPLSAEPNKKLPTNWINIPGALGCTSEICSFNNNLTKLSNCSIFGLSAQSVEYVEGVKERLKLNYTLLSDEKLILMKLLNLPNFEVDGHTLFKRITLIISNNKIEKVFYPIFPPNKHVFEVIDYMRPQHKA